MNVQAEVSFYPLRTERIGAALNQFVDTLEQADVEVSVGPMSTRIDGETNEVFEAVRQAFTQTAETYPSVLVLKLSNSCPTKVNENPWNID